MRYLSTIEKLKSSLLKGSGDSHCNRNGIGEVCIYLDYNGMVFYHPQEQEHTFRNAISLEKSTGIEIPCLAGILADSFGKISREPLIVWKNEVSFTFPSHGSCSVVRIV